MILNKIKNKIIIAKIPYRSIAIWLFTVLLSSCLKETAVPIESAFTIETSEDKTSPVTIQLKNESYGAEEYEWTFEDAQGKGLTPASDEIAEDMKFGTSFDLSTIKDDKVRENLERLSKKSDDEQVSLSRYIGIDDIKDNIVTNNKGDVVFMYSKFLVAGKKNEKDITKELTKNAPHVEIHYSNNNEE